MKRIIASSDLREAFVKSSIAEERLQETEWNNWTDNDKVNEWVRKRVFSIISANPRPNLVVTWMGRTTPMANMDAPMIRTDVATAEMVKYSDNVWHALKVAFTNEIGNICKAVGIDGHKVMDIFCQDTKLNLSSYYMKPGFAFGGSCLPKDVRALCYKARSMDLDVPVLNAIMPSNARQVEKGLKMIMDKGEQAIRDEFERLMPLMKSGGFIPSVDHQTPPNVTIEQYRLFRRLLDEYTAAVG